MTFVTARSGEVSLLTAPKDSYTSTWKQTLKEMNTMVQLVEELLRGLATAADGAKQQ